MKLTKYVTVKCTILECSLDHTSEQRKIYCVCNYFYRNTKGVESIECSSPNKALVKYSSKAEAVEAAKKLNSVKLKGEYQKWKMRAFLK